MNIAIIGSGVISVFESIYQKLIGNKVTMISKDSKIGGTWSSASFDNGNIITDLGVHYIEEIANTEKNMNMLLGKTIRLNKKYVITKDFNGKIYSKKIKKNNLYLDGGSIYLEKRLNSLIKKFDVKRMYGTLKNIEILSSKNLQIEINKEGSEKYINFEKIIFTSGLQGVNFYSNKKIIQYPLREEGVRLRSHAYFYFDFDKSKDFEQCICKDNEFIKYIHDVTNDSIGNDKSKRLVVASLSNGLKTTKKTIDRVKEIFDELEICKSEFIEHLHSIETYLADFNEKNGNFLASQSNGCIEYIHTEDFGKSFGEYASKYIDLFKEKRLLAL